MPISTEGHPASRACKRHGRSRAKSKQIVIPGGGRKGGSCKTGNCGSNECSIRKQALATGPQDHPQLAASPAAENEGPLVWKGLSFQALHFVGKAEARLWCIDKVGLSSLDIRELKFLFDFVFPLVREPDDFHYFAPPNNAPAGRLVPVERMTGLQFVVRPEFFGPHVNQRPFVSPSGVSGSVKLRLVTNAIEHLDRSLHR